PSTLSLHDALPISGSTTAARSAGTPRSAVSLTARITAAGISCARAHSRITADSMSHASAPASTQSRAFALGVATTSSTVTSVPTRRRPAASAVAWRAPVGPTTVSGTTRSPSARSGERAPQTPADTTNAGGAMRRAQVERAGAGAHAQELERPRPVMRPLATGDAREPEQAREAPGSEVDCGEDGDARHAPGGSGVPSRCCDASFARSQAAYELPAAVSLPLNMTVRTAASGLSKG